MRSRRKLEGRGSGEVFSAIFASVVEGFILFDLIAMSCGAVCRRMQQPSRRASIPTSRNNSETWGTRLCIYTRRKLAALFRVPGIGGGEVFAFAEFAHCFGLMGSDLKVGA